jgi:hypothetical protein
MLRVLFVLEMAVIAVGLLFVITQAIIPFSRGTRMFPIFKEDEEEESETKTDSGEIQKPK